MKLEETGVTITSLTCDGPSVHFTMATKLGASVTNIHKLKTFFPHPVDKRIVYIIFDACHMIKLLRNNWYACEAFEDTKGREVNYGLTRKLHNI